MLTIECCSRMQGCVPAWLPPQMILNLYLVILFSWTVLSQPGLEEVFFSPQDQSVREGEDVSFRCVSGESLSPTSIFWLKDGHVVTTGRQIQGEYGGGQQKKTSGTLHLLNVSLEDDGRYVCVTYSPSLNISKKSQPARLTVLGVPHRLRITRGPDNTTVAVGTEVSMHCAVRGFPVPMVHWFKDDCLLTKCSASFSLHNNGQLLTFRNVSKEDEGFYRCEASNLKESIKSQAAFLLLAEMDWNFIQQPTNVTAKKGDNITISCRPPYSRPAASVSWFKNNHLLRPRDHVNVLPGGDLLILSIQEEDSGSYFCRAANVHIQRFVTSRRATVTVHAAPSVRLWPHALTVPLEGRVSLYCQVSGEPPPSISFVKRGHSKQTGARMVLGLRNATLHIESARSYDEGAYVCEATSTLGHSRATATLTVAVSPIIVTYAGQVTCKVGASAVLPCVAIGVPPIWYNWTRGAAEIKQPIGTSERKHIDEDGALHLSKVQWSDAGEYFCTAENRAGRHKRRTILSVTAEHHLQDGGQQTRAVLSASNNTSDRSQLHPSTNARKTQKPHMQEEYNMAKLCSSSHCDMTANTLPKAEIKAPPTISPSVAHMQPPMLPPPPYPNFQILSTRKPTTAEPLLYSRLHHQLATHLQLQVGEKLSAESSSKGLDGHSMESLQEILLSGRSPTPVDQSSTSQINLHPSTSHGSQTKLVQTNHSSITVTSLFPEFHLDLTPTQHPESQIPSQTSTKLSIDTPPTDFNSLPPQTDSSPSVFTHPPDPSTLDPLESLGQLNASQPQQRRPVETSKAEDEEQRNTSQSPMTSNHPHYSVTQQSPSWLPVLEKHDVPIVVGVGVSLAFIFVTVAFYSVVQKNEPAPTSRAGWESNDKTQRNLGVPVRHAERRAAGRTYENRAFEDDECVAVIEHNTSTCDTRARPPGLSLVTVQMEPTCEDLHEEAHTCSPGDHSVTVETYPEPIADTKIDSCVEEEKACTPPSPPSVQQQCPEDWHSNAGDTHSFCQDTLPPPSTPSPTPSPLPSPRGAGLRSSLTLQGTESLAAPIHHILSISHGSPPLMLSHYVSLGHTTVAVDVHFYPEATSAPVNSASTFSSSFVPRLANSQDSDKARVDHNK
ncbi:hemicentin-1 isoform X1 [Entelurus aequoreus]|uniref:hemicentin-1 isoform X1 n=1 Tax=Entelurus aequoreus TaxID=161455 RepID=UPI002B1D4A9C|nr:hemicentin-1 isoform X1 [Entelurus aequoreus]XP_061880476.1 hemicentin-1 isoform X1 [Entelurus aequoreus]